MNTIMMLVLAMATGLGVLSYPTHSAPRADDVKIKAGIRNASRRKSIAEK